MKEREFARKLTSRLDDAPLSSTAEMRLRKAREAAVNHAMAKGAVASSVVMSGNVLMRFWHGHRMACMGLLLTLLVAIAGSAWQWRQMRAAERALDIELLADDVPVDFLLNDRVDAWKRR